MWNVEDILKMMNDGMTPDEIADSFTTALNEAIAENETACANRCKHRAMEELVECFFNYIDTFYPHLKMEHKPEVIETMANELVESVDHMAEMFIPEEEKTKTKDDDAITAFLKAFGLV